MDGRAVICVRVSPRPAENVRYSPEIQEQKCREWCVRKGLAVVDVVRDILVSGGAVNRFESIYRAIDEHHPTHFVVSDLSRWTRDRPSRFWAMKAVLEDAEITLATVDEEYLNTPDMPFADSITTIRVEANYLQRVEANRKTSAGVRSAWASGKRFGKIWGWTFDPETRRYTQDAERIKSFFTDFAGGMSTHALGRKYGVLPGHVHSHLRAASQREVVGEDLWNRVQARIARRARTQRADAGQSSLYRGLLFCPFCAKRMTHHSSAWNNYRCTPPRDGEHAWTMLSATQHVEPVVRAVIDTMSVPLNQAEALLQAERAAVATVSRSPEDIRKEIEKHAVSWAKGRLSESRYEALVAELDEELARVPAPPPTPDEQVGLVRALADIDLADRDPETGRYVNALLRELFQPFMVREDRSVAVMLKPEYEHWRMEPKRYLTRVV